MLLAMGSVSIDADMWALVFGFSLNKPGIVTSTATSYCSRFHTFVGISVSFGLTITSLDAFGPCVIKLRVDNISTVLKPGTTGTTATEFARFAASATFRTHCGHVLGDRRQLTCRS